MKYRIVMNGNGKFRVQRRGWVLWYTLRVNADPLGEWWGAHYDDADGDGWCAEWHSSADACEALLKAQEADSKLRREGQWSVVVTDEVK